MLLCSLGSSQDIARNRLGPMLSITPISVNQNPRLIKALHDCDISLLKRLFTTYAARPTDIVLDPVFGDHLNLIEVGLSPWNCFYTIC